MIFSSQNLFAGTIQGLAGTLNNISELKGGFPLGEIFRPNRNFLLSYKHSDGTNQKSFEFEQ
jgi:hypothetical protein